VEDGWTAIALDARGHGDSEWTSSYRLDDFIGDLERVTEILPEPPIILGASLGGRTGLVGVGEGRGRCSALVLLDIAPRINRGEQQRVHAFLARGLDGFDSLEEASAAIDAYRPTSKRRENVDGLRKNLRLRADGRWYWHWDPQFLEFGENAENSSADRMNVAATRVLVPTMLVRGTKSKMVSDEAAMDLVHRLPFGELAEVDSGHMITGDDNGVFTARLGHFLNRIGMRDPDAPRCNPSLPR